MKRFLIGLAALMMPAGVAAAQESPRERVEALIRCSEIRAVPERVRCYDEAVAALRGGLQRGEVVVADPRTVAGPERRSPTLSRFAANVMSVENRGGIWRLALSNGQTWETLDRRSEAPPRPGTQVRIHKNLVQSFWMRISGSGEFRVRRVE